MLGQIKVTYSDRKEKQTNKVRRINAIGGDNTMMANKVVYENVCSTIYWSRLEI